MRVLLFDESDEGIAELQELLAGAGYDIVGVETSARYLADRVEQLLPDLVLLAAESPSRDTMEQVCAVTDRSPRPIVLLTSDTSPDLMRKAMNAGISAYLVQGLPMAPIDTLFDLAVARFEEDQRLRAELRDARTQLADRKLIERAKGLLMKRRGCDEAQAHRLLLRMAMDRHLKLRDVAEQVVSIDSLFDG
jgi:response regulator NasT